MLPLRIGLALGAVSLAGLAAFHDSQLVFAAWLPLMGAGMAFALAAIGALVLDHSRPEETGVTSAMNTIMRTSGAAIGATIAAVLVSAHPGTDAGYAIAFAMGALGLLARAGADARARAAPTSGRRAGGLESVSNASMSYPARVTGTSNAAWISSSTAVSLTSENRRSIVVIALGSFKVGPRHDFAMFSRAGDRAVGRMVNAMIDGLASGWSYRTLAREYDKSPRPGSPEARRVPPRSCPCRLVTRVGSIFRSMPRACRVCCSPNSRRRSLRRGGCVRRGSLPRLWRTPRRRWSRRASRRDCRTRPRTRPR